MTSTNSIRAILAIAAVVFTLGTAGNAAAQGRTIGGTGQTGGAGQTGGGGGGQTVGAGSGAQAIGSNQPSGAVTGEIGRSSDRMLQDVGTATTGGAAGGLGGLGGLGGFGGGRGFGGFGGLSPFGANPFGTNNSASTKPSIRTRLVNGVEPASTAIAGTTTIRPQVQYSTAPVSKIVNGYSIAVVDGVATVSGVARTAKDRRMAELVLKLEPGINKVENRIVVSP